MMRILIISLLALIVVFSASCKKRRENKSTTTSQDNAAVEAGFNDVFRVTESAIKDNDLEKGGMSYQSIYGSCASITISPALPDPTFPKTLTIDFGTTNCQDAYGVNRRGKIIAVITGKYRDFGTKITITPQNYYLNDNKIEGSKVVENLGQNTEGNTEFSVDISNAKVTFTDGKFTTYESSRIREWVAGEATDGLTGILDDEYELTGVASGTDRNGRDYDMLITSPLRVATVCKWIKSGVVEVQPDGLALRTVNFGDGDCDATVSVVVNNNTYHFVMP